jgi:hypothetical protein
MCPSKGERKKEEKEIASPEVVSPNYYISTLSIMISTAV